MEKPYQLPLGGGETNEKIVQEAVRADAEEKEEEFKQLLIAEAMKAEGSLSYGERKKGPGRTAARMLAEKFRQEDEEEKKKKKTEKKEKTKLF